MNFCVHSARPLRTEKIMFCFGLAFYWSENEKFVYNNQQCFAFQITSIMARKFKLAVWGSDSIKRNYDPGALPLNLCTISPTDLKWTHDLFSYLWIVPNFIKSTALNIFSQVEVVSLLIWYFIVKNNFGLIQPIQKWLLKWEICNFWIAFFKTNVRECVAWNLNFKWTLLSIFHEYNNNMTKVCWIYSIRYKVGN